ncbi:MAG: AI-2E family transporter [Saprospiraceae bacterium]|mgnify:FL=1|nr:AI-2E family transporter [Saprospiraceae bacterium]
MNAYGRVLVVGIPILIVGAIIYYFNELVSYLLLAWVISMVGRPINDFLLDKAKLSKIKIGNSISAFLTLAIFGFMIYLLIILFLPVLIEQAHFLSKVDYQTLAKSLETPLQQFNNLLKSWGIEGLSDSSAQLKLLFQRYFLPDKLGDLFEQIIPMAGHMLFGIFSVIFMSFFFLKEHGLFVDFLENFVPQRFESKVRNTVDESSRLLIRYFSGILIQITLVSVLTYIGMLILGINNALIIGVLAGLFNVIPYLGPLISASVAVFITLSSYIGLDFYAEMWPLLLNILIAFAIVKIIDDFIIQPFVFSNRIMAHPLEIFIIIMIGARISGVSGMILALPTYTVFRVFAKVFLSEFEIIQRIVGGIKANHSAEQINADILKD